MKRSTNFGAMGVLLFAAPSLSAAIQTADVAVHSPSGQYVPMEAGTLWNNWFQYYWYELPAFADGQGYEMWESQLTGFPSVADGVTTFEVLTDGIVLMAVTTRWGGGGNSSGDWMDDVTTREQLEQQGWSEYATGLSVAQFGNTFPKGGWEYIVFQRESVAGETFSYRTEKYVGPLIIRGDTVVPEPSSLIVWSLLGLAVRGTAYRRLNRAGA